jgi:hypothetical protein
VGGLDRLIGGTQTGGRDLTRISYRNKSLLESECPGACRLLPISNEVTADGGILPTVEQRATYLYPN